ncbi:hypothetical protein ElyMa_006297700 [Elysia marginata]|uniref:Uncharacterized protein n=1 Tax=Elysia marginata TaxID=1093978 RepID=A0AAV4HE28_9GAST|nr:hypothetical protein ElyMa_006297700 [Elysia marginata]
MFSSLMKNGRLQVLLFLCCLLFVLACLLFAQPGPRRWTASVNMENLKDDEGFETKVSKEIFYQPSSSEKNFSEPILTNVSDLTQLLRERLALPNDALKITHKGACEGHETDVQPCSKEGCPALSAKPLEKRIKDLVLSPQFQLNDDQLRNILRVVRDVPETDIIIATASSSNHFKEMQAMFKALHSTVYPKLTNFTVVVFDIGLKKRQRKLTEKYCRCRVLTFPFKLFPPHVRELHCYGWKAIMIRGLITKARKLLIWQDTSIRWTDEFLSVFHRAMVFGQQFLESMHGARLTSHTLPQMFAYMGEESCQYFAYRETQCGFQVLKHDPLVIQAILNPWTRCALEQSCMCPVVPESVIRCSKSVSSFEPRCHRFDQSAMSIILSKLYAADRYRFAVPEYSNKNPKYVSIKRGDRLDDYFSRDGSLQ